VNGGSFVVERYALVCVCAKASLGRTSSSRFSGRRVSEHVLSSSVLHPKESGTHHTRTVKRGPHPTKDEKASSLSHHSHFYVTDNFLPCFPPTFSACYVIILEYGVYFLQVK